MIMKLWQNHDFAEFYAIVYSFTEVGKFRRKCHCHGCEIVNSVVPALCGV